ncbi:hypothetical protein CRUP_008392 [Coryphaenoides rupestris]|nr:hypothetical protein CRUP_008392 [Coryphaenoides rupestris]
MSKNDLQANSLQKESFSHIGSTAAMGGLGNGRRGGRSPPLMIGALIACILVLGFNYWMSSSRNLELQTELEEQVRRGAAERAMVELKKVELQQQGEKISGTMQLNISSSTKTIQQLKGQLSQQVADFGKLQKQLQSCQGNLNTLTRKLTYDMTQCNTQILSLKELCDERVAELQKKLEKLSTAPVVSQQANDGTAPAEKVGNQAEEGKPAVDETKTTPVLNHNTGLPGPESKSLVKVAAEPIETLPPLEGAVTPQQAGPASLKLQNHNLTEDEGVEVMDVKDEDIQIEGKEGDPGVEDMLIEQDKVEPPASQKVGGPEEYEGEEQIVGGVDPEKDKKQRGENTDKDMEDEVADYNGDDDNEGEFEADKQAELAQD